MKQKGNPFHFLPIPFICEKEQCVWDAWQIFSKWLSRCLELHTSENKLFKTFYFISFALSLLRGHFWYMLTFLNTNSLTSICSVCKDAAILSTYSYQFFRLLALLSDSLQVSPDLCPEMSTAKIHLYLGCNKI